MEGIGLGVRAELCMTLAQRHHSSPIAAGCLQEEKGWSCNSARSVYSDFQYTEME